LCQLKEIGCAESRILSSQSRFRQWLKRPKLLTEIVKLTQMVYPGVTATLLTPARLASLHVLKELKTLALTVDGGVLLVLGFGFFPLASEGLAISRSSKAIKKLVDFLSIACNLIFKTNFLTLKSS
jgi:hypothetical protein